jgi:hypothetical protein
MIDGFSEDLVQPLYTAAGAIVINWGFVDSGVSHTASILYENLGGNPSQAEPPRALSNRLDFLRRCFRDKPKLAAEIELARLTREMKIELASWRDFLAHGALTGWDAAGQWLKFAKVDSDKTKYWPSRA